MSDRKYVTSQEIEQARQLDLLSFLEQYRPYELIKLSPGVYSMRSHDSLKISNGRWYRWSTGKGGVSALDYLISVENMPFVEAVQYICGCCHNLSVEVKPLPEKTPKVFLLPKPYSNNKKVIEYLALRGISRDIIDRCINDGILYEDTRHNCCFVGKDENGAPRYAMLRSTSPHHTFLIDAQGSNKEYSFHLSVGISNTLFLFESAIDLLSYFDLCGQADGNYVSVAGIYQPKKNKEVLPIAISHFLSRNPQIKNINICFDNDDKGTKAAQAVARLLTTEYDIKLMPPEVGKDYNDQLLIRKGIPKTVKTRCANSAINKEEIIK